VRRIAAIAMTLRFDPGHIERFKADIQRIPGYPAGEVLPIQEMVFESGALFKLPGLLTLAGAQPKRPLFVVMDQTPIRRGAEDLKPLLLAQLREAGWRPEPIWLEADATGQVHTDFKQIERVKTRLQPHAAVLSVGSGTVTDIAKHASYLYQQEHALASLPYVAYPTANSVSAYASNMAPVFVEGVKRTLASRYPDVLVCDLETLRDAPPAMTVAGVGDLLAAFNSYADWYLAYRLGLDGTYTEFAETLMGPLDQIFLAHAEAIRTRTLEGMEVLAKLITLGGLAMSLSHATAPLSGYEHVMSHLLDFLAESGGRPLAQHGTQVALAAIFTTAAFQIFLEEFEPAEVNPERCYPSAEQMHARLQTALGPLDPSGRAVSECWSDYRRKLEAWHQHRPQFESLLRDWPEVRAKVQSLVRPPGQVIQILQAVGGPLSFEEFDPPVSSETVKFAFLNAPLIRQRMTLGDLLLFLNWDSESLWASVRQAGVHSSREPSHHRPYGG
jgi:glycerol-1-phosphate dehydrogenase [NAD(P)+]